jgi:hypothetical protein
MTIAARLDFIVREQALESWHLSQEVGKMLAELARSLKSKREKN